jgi:hypothetical protein
MPDKPQPGGYIWEEQMVKARRSLELIRACIRKLIAVFGEDTNTRVNRILTDMLLAITDLQSALGEIERIGHYYKQQRTKGDSSDPPTEIQT